MKKTALLFIIAILLGIAVTNSRREDAPKTDSFARDRLEMQEKCTNNQTCFTKEIYDLVYKKGHIHATAVLSDLIKIEGSRIPDCHLIAHSIGRAIFDANKNDWRKIVGDVDFMCNYGIPHGIIESYLLSLNGKSISETEVLKGVCPQNMHLSCYHVIGHILVLDKDGNINEALDRCDVFSDKQIENCYDGAFMENTYNSLSLEHGIVELDDLAPFSERIPDLIMQCNSYTEYTRSIICFREIARAGLSAHKFDIEEALGVCAQAMYPEAREECEHWMRADMAQRRNKTRS